MDDMLFECSEFILEINSAAPGGTIESYSLDGSSYDHNSGMGPTTYETSYVFV